MQKLLAAFGLALALFLAPAFGQDDELEKGVEMYRSGDFAGAVAALQKLVEAEPKNRLAWRYLGGSLFHLHQEKEAIKAFKKSTGGSKPDTRLDKDLKIIRRQKVRYTESARNSGTEGTVVNLVEFKADGTIGFVVNIQGLPYGLTENSIESAKSTVFTPAERNGKPVSVIRIMSHSFNIY